MAGSGDITGAFGGSGTPYMGEPGNRSLQKFRQQVKIMTTRITVINRFARKYRAKSLQCGIAPGLTAASPQFFTTVKDLLEKSITSEGSKTRNLSISGTPLSPNSPVQDAPKQKFKLETSEKKNGEGFLKIIKDAFKDHLALSTIQIALILLTFKILEEADLLDEAFFGLIIVTVIALDSRQEGTRPTYNPVGRIALRGLLLLLCLSNFEKSGVCAQNNSEDGNLGRPNERGDLPYNVQLVAWTVAVIILIALLDGRVNRRPLVPAPAAAPLALPPAAAPPALPAAAAAPRAVPAQPIGFINVTDVLADNPDPARISDPDYNILPRLD